MSSVEQSDKEQQEQQDSSRTLREEMAAAILARTIAQNTTKTSKQLAEEHETKQAFRRLIDPAIMRPNHRETALAALKTLETLSDNILRDPRNPKYASFKPTNATIKRNIVDVKGALEYAVALGFHSVTQNYQPLYAFNPRHLEDLSIGNAMLKERLAHEGEKDKRASVHQESEKERKAAVAQNVRLAYHDDRKTKAEKDALESQLRAIRAARAAEAPLTPPSSSKKRKARMPSAGMTLSGERVNVGAASAVEPVNESSLTHDTPTTDDEEEADSDGANVPDA